MTIVLSGDNDFAVRQASRELRSAFALKYGTGAVSVCDGVALTVAELPQLLHGVSLFEPKRLIAIKEASANKAVWEALPEWLPTDDSTVVILEESKPDKRTRTYKWLQQHADMRDFPALKESGVMAWLRSEVSRRHLELAAPIVARLIARVGPDQWALSQALDKLQLAGSPVTEATLDQLIEPNPQASAFELLDATLAKDWPRVASLTTILRHTEDAYRLTGLLISQVYGLALAFGAGDRPAATLAKEAGLHPYVAGKLLATARQLSRSELSSVITAVSDLDEQLKSTGADPWVLLESALMRIARR